MRALPLTLTLVHTSFFGGAGTFRHTIPPYHMGGFGRCWGARSQLGPGTFPTQFTFGGTGARCAHGAPFGASTQLSPPQVDPHRTVVHSNIGTQKTANRMSFLQSKGHLDCKKQK